MTTWVRTHDITMAARLLPLTIGALAVLTAAAVGAAGPASSAPAGRSAATASPHCAPYGTKGIALKHGGRLDVLDSMAQVLPKQHQSGGSSVFACEARNAFASFQLEVSAPKNAALTGVRLKASDLTGPGGATIEHQDVRMYREAYTTLTRLSNGELSHVLPRTSSGTCEGDCRFPDELIPDVDALVGQKRNAFPFTVTRGENRAVWVDVQVPARQRTGVYRGSIAVTGASGAKGTVPVRLQVISPTLPSTSSVRGTFLLTKGGGRVPDVATLAQYQELGLDDRISVTSNSAMSAADLKKYEGPLLTGKDTRVLLKGAALTDIQLSNNFGEPATTAYYKSVLNALGVAGKASGYCDEIPAATCAQAYDDGGTFSSWPNLPLIPVDGPSNGWPDPESGTVVPASLADHVTAPIVLDQYVDPTRYYVEHGYGDGVSGSRMPGLERWRSAAHGRQVWAYLTCESGGCGNSYRVAAFNAEWPSYGIDQIASEQTAMGWQLFNYGLDGELYYDTSNCLDGCRDGGGPLYHDGVNGDGTLFYRWNKSLVGGTTPIPLESIRLKRIRDGRQDYELLRLATKGSAARASAARKIAIGLYPAMDRSSPSAADVDAARRRLAALFLS